MKQLKKTFVIIPFFILSCASGQYLKSYEPINVFLDTQKIDKDNKYIMQSDKEQNTQALRIFNGSEGSVHVKDPTDPMDYTNGLFVEKYWNKIYNEYAQDTLKRYWKNEDISEYNFVLEKGTGLTLKESFLRKYMNSGINEMIIISEPMYYMNKKYIMFYFEKRHFGGSSSPMDVIMKKEENKWVVVQIIRDYIYN